VVVFRVEAGVSAAEIVGNGSVAASAAVSNARREDWFFMGLSLFDEFKQ
jgi:hypothetical protein